MAKVTEKNVKTATSLRELNGFLTELMARQRMQPLLKDGEWLDALLDTVKKLADREGVLGALIAIALLGRLVAVARGKEEELRLRQIAVELVRGELPPFEMLADGDEKTYAAQSLLDIQGAWVFDYAIREAMAIDQAENARQLLLEVALRDSPSIAVALQSCAATFASVAPALNAESRARRAKRISTAWAALLTSHRKEPGQAPGHSLREFALSLIPARKLGVADEVSTPIAEDVLGILTRLVELRFSLALGAETYGALFACRTQLGRDAWYRFLQQSKYAEHISTFLNETALVLARQGRTDLGIIDALLVVHSDRASLYRSLSRHFPSTLELEPGVKSWWLKGGVASSQSGEARNEAVNTSEDQRIGEALIQVEKLDPTIRYLASTVRPEIEFSNGPAAAALSRVAGAYKLLAQHLRQLAKMRRLSVTQLEGSVVEYNQAQHEMLGGHVQGVRQVKVVRDGVEKQYPNRQAILVKPWVESTKE